MKKSPPPSNRIGELRKEKGLTQQQLADLIGSHWITVSKLERGIMRLTPEWRAEIAEALGVKEWDLVPEAQPLPTVHVEAVIEEGGEILALDPEDAESFTLSSDYFVNPAYRWLYVAGDALWPLYQDGDRLCVRHVEKDEVEAHRGRVVVAWFDNKGKTDAAIGTLERGRRLGLYTINRIGLPPIKDKELTDLAIIAMAIYELGPAGDPRE